MALVTIADYENLPSELGYKPKRVEVTDYPGTVRMAVVRKWYQRLGRYRKRRMKSDIAQEISIRKMVGIYVILTVR